MIPINVELGLNVNNKIEYIPLGIFNIDKVKKDDFTIKITAYDNMSKFKIPYFSSLGSTATLTQVVNEIAAKTGVQFEGNLPNYSVKKLEGFSCREILSYVASLCAGNAIIKRNGKFTILYPTDINRDIGEGVFDLQREEVKYKVGKITCKVEDKTISKGSLGANSMELQFENPWINETILVDIYNRLSGFEYLGYTLKWQGDPSLEIGDIITYKDDKGVIRKLPIFNIKLSYDGGLDSELSAKGETKNKNSFDSSGSIKKKIDRVVTELAIVNEALIDVAYIGDLTAGNIKFDTASGTIMDLQTLLAKFVTGENGQFLNLTTDNVTISNALIKDVIAKSISVEDLKASTISTNKFKIASDNGGIEIVGATQQFKDKNSKVRIQMGQDTQGNFNFILRGEDGTTTLIDHTGIKEKAIADKLIKSNMVADGAIGEQQINYSSLVTGLNKDTNTQLIKASKVAIDLTGQSLEVSFNSLKSNLDNIEVGGRNLAVYGSIASYSPTTSTATLDLSNFIKEGGVIISRSAQPNYGPMLDRYVAYEEGKQYIISFKMKAISDGVNSFHVYNGYGHIFDSIYIDGVRVGRMHQELAFPTDKNYHKVEIYFTASATTNPPESQNTQHTLLQVMKTTAIAYTVQLLGFKIEEGTKATDWTPAPEDVDSKIEANTTAITVAQGKIEGLIKESTINKSDVTTLKDNYTSIKATVDGINTTVASHTSSIGNLTTDLSGISGKVTTVETKQATLEQNLNGFKTTVSNSYSTKTELNTLNGTVTSIQQRVNTVEQSITATSITTTISSAINAGTSSISTTQFVMDNTGFTVKNGAIKVQNKAGETVMTSDSNGNLVIQSSITTGGLNNKYGTIKLLDGQSRSVLYGSKDGVKATKIDFYKDYVLSANGVINDLPISTTIDYRGLRSSNNYALNDGWASVIELYGGSLRSWNNSTPSSVLEIIDGNIYTPSGKITADRIHATSNGQGTNLQIGDDVWIGDINESYTMRVYGVNGNGKGYIRFGTGGKIGYGGGSDIDIHGSIWVLGNIICDGGVTGSDRYQGKSEGAKFYLGHDKFRVDTTGGTIARLYNSWGGQPDSGIYIQDDGTVGFRSYNTVRHILYGNGSKTGGSMEIDGTVYGMSPTDSPQTLIEYIIPNVIVKGELKLDLDPIYIKMISYYVAFLSNKNIEVKEKGQDYITLLGNGTTDILIKGQRKGADDYYRIMGGLEHGVTEEQTV